MEVIEPFIGNKTYEMGKLPIISITKGKNAYNTFFYAMEKVVGCL